MIYESKEAHMYFVIYGCRDNFVENSPLLLLGFVRRRSLEAHEYKNIRRCCVLHVFIFFSHVVSMLFHSNIAMLGEFDFSTFSTVLTFRFLTFYKLVTF